jgi:hypothetical protein
MSNKKNNPFADLEKNHSRDFREGSGHHNVQRGLDSTLGTARMLGSIADVYLSRFVGTMMSMAGSKDDQAKPGEGGGRRKSGSTKSKYPNL